MIVLCKYNSITIINQTKATFFINFYCIKIEGNSEKIGG